MKDNIHTCQRISESKIGWKITDFTYHVCLNELKMNKTGGASDQTNYKPKSLETAIFTGHNSETVTAL